MTAADILEKGLEHYKVRTGKTLHRPGAVMFDMDGVLYDSMPGHAVAWKQMCDENGLEAVADEFFAYEGRTGASTIEILYMRQFGHKPTQEDIKRLYARKCVFFNAMGEPPMMPGASDAVGVVLGAGVKAVLVTGSGQTSILDRLVRDYPGAFLPEHRVTSRDVLRGKPDPEPYLMGLEKAGVAADYAIAIDNAPLGVEAASGAGVFTIGVRTGPVPEGCLMDAGADVELTSMTECARLLEQIFRKTL